MMRKLMSHRILLLFMLGLLALAVVGCSDDDDPGTPGGDNNGSSDQFDEATAEAMTPMTVALGTETAERVADVSDGIDASKDGTWSWDAENQWWVYHYSWDDMGSYDWTLTAQYLDTDGNPVQFRMDAMSAHLVMNGTGDFQYQSEAYSYSWSSTYSWDLTITGLHTTTYTANGGGNYVIDYTVNSGGMTYSRHFVVDWEILDPGLSRPVGGCPTGTIRFTMTPYTLDMTFDGTSTAEWVLKDGSGNTVNEGTESLECGS